MQIVIDIDENVFTRLFDNGIQDNEIATDDICEMARALRLGIPLPKGHGRIGDLSKIYDRLNDAQIEGTVEYKGLGEAKQIICDAPTIIEADKESEVRNDKGI